ncbi:T9SS type A sorting domain-containing protein [Gracilimonas sediminicola]|uniref:T9SS type A sorting domain-containing protein n=1 Tax=Gracilimonas sediminicola TaxID=2952158 RepID=A0A9X2RF89_9BACT|nr:T9SS type A sorting domain-containing protein [Gracilimonas sediminicola]MCP9292495.1 T9SS type A sorting domain-containing protein [Gracilimonas sediminicola]
MFDRTINTIVAGLVVLFLTSGVELQAQSSVDDGRKSKKSALLFKHSDKPLLPSDVLNARFKTDNDIGRSTMQWASEEGWMDAYRITYSYSTDRLTITQNWQIYDGEGWVGDGAYIFTFSEEGYPLSYSFEFGGDVFSEVFHYSAGRLDSATFSETYEGASYSEKIELEYVTDDSIQIYSTVFSEGGQPELTGYFVNREDAFVEVYYETEYTDRYIYSGIDFDEYLTNVFNEFFFVEMYNDEYYEGDDVWIPYSRTTLAYDGQLVIEVEEEYFYESEGEWMAEYRNTFTYENGKIAEDLATYSFDGMNWDDESRTLYEYGMVTSIDEVNDDISTFKLSQNYPNPFNPTTQIAYEISAPGKVLLEVYNVLGERVATLVNANQVAGEYVAGFNASGFPSGIYYYKLVSGQHQQVRSMTLIK